jgi:oligopeptide/dipeptide ABC transporter ATP-binding protein
LDVRNLKTYLFTPEGVVRAIDGINLEVREKEAVGIVGESGCGKTMTALSIMRMVPDPPGRIVNGEIMYKDKNLMELPESDMRRMRGKEISIVFQDPMTFLDPVMRVGDQIMEAISLHQHESRVEDWRKMLEVLEMVRLPSPYDISRCYPHELSGGMRQRILIAIAISCNPSLLILDEPTTALDVTIQLQIIKLIKRLREELGISLILITHDLGVVSEIVDKIYVMYAGRFVEVADVFTLFKTPTHPYTKGLLDSVLSISELKEDIRSIKGTVPNLINVPSGCRFHPRCKYAKPICRKREPLPVEVEKSHFVSCWLCEEN